MKKSNIVILAALLVIVITIGIKIYPSLSAKYSPEVNPVETAPNSSSDGSGTTDDAEVTADIAPDFTVTDADGNSVSLSDNSGKPIIVNFWATWCSPCKSELPHFETMYKEYGDSITFMMVNLTDGYRDTLEGVIDFISSNGYTFPVYFDLKLEAADTYGILSIPTTVFINSDGEIVDTVLGSLTEETLQSYIDLLIEYKSE